MENPVPVTVLLPRHVVQLIDARSGREGRSRAGQIRWLLYGALGLQEEEDVDGN